jgi:hypothetical protein
MIYSGKLLPRNKIPETGGRAESCWEEERKLPPQIALSYVVVTVPGTGAPKEELPILSAGAMQTGLQEFIVGQCCNQPGQRFTVSSSTAGVNQLVIDKVITELN